MGFTCLQCKEHRFECKTKFYQHFFIALMFSVFKEIKCFVWNNFRVDYIKWKHDIVLLS